MIRRCTVCSSEKVKGVLLQPDQVGVVGLVDAEACYLIGIRIVSEGGEPFTIILPLEFMPTFIGLLNEKSAEMLAGMTAPRS